ncbi:MAG TPA: hypothetical protein PLU22_13480 [Polyangiaceae bacterium]|nr:hypothetical protein [Polyangiaceae bacterium]
MPFAKRRCTSPVGWDPKTVEDEPSGIPGGEGAGTARLCITGLGPAAPAAEATPMFVP